MAISSTTFAERLKAIDSGKTTSWTVPGEGLADYRDERRFLSKANVKMRQRSTGQKTGILKYLIALLAGAVSVIAARWLDYTFLDTVLAFAEEKGVDATNLVADIPTPLVLALVFCVMSILIFGLRKSALPLVAAGFMGAFLFEADLVALAPDLYAKFYPPAWVADMMASATLIT